VDTQNNNISTNPMVGVMLYDDGTVNFEFRGETGGVQEYLFTNLHLLDTIGLTFLKAAEDCTAIQTGTRSFEDVVEEYGGIAVEGEDETPLTYEDFEQYLTPDERNVAPRVAPQQQTLPSVRPDLGCAPAPDAAPSAKERVPVDESDDELTVRLGGVDHSAAEDAICAACDQRPTATGQCGCS
jgi:hypothetical protein